MKTTAAVLIETGQPLEIADLEIPTLVAGQALVEVRYSGVCHTQLLEVRGHRGPDAFVPHCLGHEGVGIVREVGPGVTRVDVDDAVVLSWIKARGLDIAGTKYRWNGRTVNAGGITTFSRFAVVSENRLTPIASALLEPAGAMLGCALPTGIGAVVNTGGAQLGQNVVVFGLGGVGLCAVIGGALAGCHPVVGVDLQPAKLELARRFGATHVIHAGENDVVDQLQGICRGGVDIAIEATGRPDVMADALRSVRPRGGAAVVIGNARHGESVSIDPAQLNQGKRLLGTWGGDSDPDRDYPRYARLVADRRIDLAPITSRRYPLTAVNQSLDDLEWGDAIRPIIDMSLGG